VRRRQGLAVAVAIVDGIAGSNSNVIRPGAAHDGLVEVIVQGVLVREFLHVGGVALLHVIETHRG
jgi:hypothetical protein